MMARDAYKGPRILPFLRHEEISRCESCGRRRRDIDLTRGVCRCCLEVDVVTGEVIDIQDAVTRANRDYADDAITDAQRKRLFALAREYRLSETALKDIVAGVTGEATTKSLTRRTYDEVVARIESAEAHVAVMPRLDHDDPVDGEATDIHPDQESLGV